MDEISQVVVPYGGSTGDAGGEPPHQCLRLQVSSNQQLDFVQISNFEGTQTFLNASAPQTPNLLAGRSLLPSVNAYELLVWCEEAYFSKRR